MKLVPSKTFQSRSPPEPISPGLLQTFSPATFTKFPYGPYGFFVLGIKPRTSQDPPANNSSRNLWFAP
jgi:hypothetical protein